MVYHNMHVRDDIFRIIKSDYWDGLPYVTTKQLREKTGYSHSQVSGALYSLKRNGFITKPEGSTVQDGKWKLRITEKEREVMAIFLSIGKESPEKKWRKYELIQYMSFYEDIEYEEAKNLVNSTLRKMYEIKNVGWEKYKFEKP